MALYSIYQLGATTRFSMDFPPKQKSDRSAESAEAEAEAETKPKRVRSNDLPFIKKKSKDPKIETKDIYQPAHAS